MGSGAFLLGILLAASISANASILYTVRDIGTLGGRIDGYGINNNGEVTGTAGMPPINAFHAFLYSKGHIQDLGSLGPDRQNALSSQGMAINDLGEVAGYTLMPNFTYHAFLFRAGAMVDLGTLGGPYSYAWGINSLGEVTGNSEAGNRVPLAFLYSGGRMTQIGPTGFNFTEGFDINNLGQVVGGAGTGAGGVNGFLYDHGHTIWLGSLRGGDTFALAINDRSEITGSSSNRAFIYAKGTMANIAPQWSYSVGTDINNSGEVVGYYDTGSGYSRPFVFLNGKSTDLFNLVDPSLGLTAGEARGINDLGQILVNSNGRTYILTPVPEPRFVPVIVVGLIVVYGAKRLSSRQAFGCTCRIKSAWA
jgi:probable HAF family extracellular repeat protein